MKGIQALVEAIDKEVIKNYIVPGLESKLLERRWDNSILRVFHATRHQVQFVAPHTHRYALTSTVLAGTVQNTMWRRCRDITPDADRFKVVLQKFNGIGDYDFSEEVEIADFRPETKTYKVGESYFMRHEEFHSISFSKGAVVLIEESSQMCEHSWVLQPYVDDVAIDIAEVKPWMFK